jgi:choline dehydrogenase
LTDDRPYPMPRGKVFGGSSAINGTVFLRGHNEDFDEWAIRGNSLWSFAEVLPYFIRSETDLDFTGPLHGTSGPIPVRRTKREELHPVSEAFMQACVNVGFSEVLDMNVPGPGVGSLPHNSIDGIRLNTAMTYLSACLDRPNLTLQDETYVRRVLFEGSRAIGVEVDHEGARANIYAGEVVLSAGGIKSPHLLLLSGIGGADALRQYGLSVLHDSPGVGQNAVDHPGVAVPYRVDDEKVVIPQGVVPLSRAGLETWLSHTAPDSAHVEDLNVMCTALPMNKGILGRAGGRKLPSYVLRPFATLKGIRKLPTRIVLEQVMSGRNRHLTAGLEIENSRGTVSLASPDPESAPDIQLHYLTDREDLRRLRHNVRTTARLLQQPSFKALGAERIAPTDEDLASDAALDTFIAATIMSSFHTSCTARMGPESDPDAVVDQHCRVHGVDGLRVVDVSIMPTLVRRAPHATAIMIGERASAFFD